MAYDRSNLIEAAIETIKKNLIEEMIVVSLIVIALSFSLAKCVKYHYSNSNNDCHQFYPAECIWAFIQHHVADRNCFGNRGDCR